MASTINADNGVVSGSSGVKTTADTSGVLALQSNGSTALSIGTDLSVAITNASSATALRITQTGTGNALLVEDSASTDSTPLAVDASGRLVVGNTASVGNNEQFQVDNANAGVYRASTSDFSGVTVYRSRGTLASPTAVSPGDILGSYGFGAYTSGGWQGGPNTVSSYIYATHGGETTFGGSAGSIGIRTWALDERDYTWSFSASTTGSAVLSTSGGSYNSGIISLGGRSTLWNDAYSTVEVANTGSFYGTTAKVDVANNVYYNASNAFIYKTTAAATRYEQTTGTHNWYVAPSGTAGNAVTFTQALAINNSGAIGVGSSPSYGTSGQVLTSGGSGAAPTWATPGGGSWIYITTVTANDVATADVEGLDTTYDMYVIVAENIYSPSAGSNVNCRFKTGGSYATTGYAYAQTFTYSGSATVTVNRSTNANRVYLADVASNADSNVSIVMYIASSGSTTFRKPVMYQISSVQGAVVYSWPGAATLNTTAAITGVQFLPFSGTISGTFRLYGIKNS